MDAIQHSKQYPKLLQALNETFHSKMEKYEEGTFLGCRTWLLMLLSSPTPAGVVPIVILP